MYVLETKIIARLDDAINRFFAAPQRPAFGARTPPCSKLNERTNAGSQKSTGFGLRVMPSHPLRYSNAHYLNTRRIEVRSATNSAPVLSARELREEAEDAIAEEALTRSLP
jgi:hypothetical protein